MKTRLPLLLILAVAALSLASFVETPAQSIAPTATVTATTVAVGQPITPTATVTATAVTVGQPITLTATAAATAVAVEPGQPVTLTCTATTTAVAVTTGQPITLTCTLTAAAVAAPTETRTSQATVKLDMFAIFPAGPGRDVVLDNCSSSCHNWVPLVQQKTEEEWAALCRDHGVRHGLRLSGSEWGALCIYLQSHFNPSKPLPPLPDWSSMGIQHPWGTFVGY